MEQLEVLIRPTKNEQIMALESYRKLAIVLETSHDEISEVVIEESAERILLPRKAMELLAAILKATSQGKVISLVPVSMEMTTQAASEILGCSRPHLVGLLERGEIPFTKVGRHRRLQYDDVMNYRKRKKEEQERRLIEMMRMDEDLGLYDS
jgi:excisionase family DNA binding protein